MADGVKVGEVKDLLIDPQRFSVEILVLKGDKHGHHLPLNKIKSIGKDAITIEDATILDPIPKQIEPLRSFKELEGIPVVDGSGATVGTVHELIFEESGCIKTIDTRSGGVFGIGAKDQSIMIDEVRTIGPKLITIERFPSAK